MSSHDSNGGDKPALTIGNFRSLVSEVLKGDVESVIKDYGEQIKSKFEANENKLSLILMAMDSLETIQRDRIDTLEKKLMAAIKDQGMMPLPGMHQQAVIATTALANKRDDYTSGLVSVLELPGRESSSRRIESDSSFDTLMLDSSHQLPPLRHSNHSNNSSSTANAAVNLEPLQRTIHDMAKKIDKLETLHMKNQEKLRRDVMNEVSFQMGKMKREVLAEIQDSKLSVEGLETVFHQNISRVEELMERHMSRSEDSIQRVGLMVSERLELVEKKQTDAATTAIVGPPTTLEYETSAVSDGGYVGGMGGLGSSEDPLSMSLPATSKAKASKSSWFGKDSGSVTGSEGGGSSHGFPSTSAVAKSVIRSSKSFKKQAEFEAFFKSQMELIDRSLSKVTFHLAMNSAEKSAENERLGALEKSVKELHQVNINTVLKEHLADVEQRISGILSMYDPSDETEIKRRKELESALTSVMEARMKEWSRSNKKHLDDVLRTRLDQFRKVLQGSKDDGDHGAQEFVYEEEKILPVRRLSFKPQMNLDDDN